MEVEKTETPLPALGESWRVFLGAGGATPRVDLYDVNAGRVHQFLALPPGHTAYALHRSPDGTSLAVGTKGGFVYRVPTNGRSDDAKDVFAQHFSLRAPILAVSSIGSSGPVATDTTGRCFLIEQRGASPRTLPTDGRVVCTLRSRKDGSLVGLSTRGDLVFWSQESLTLDKMISGGLAPPPLSALVKLMYWPAAKALVWAGRGGLLALCPDDGNKSIFIPAHRGDFYAVTVLADYLLTVGMEDGRLRLWQPGNDRSAHEWPAPEGIISVAAWPGSQTTLLLVSREGAATVHTLDGDGLHFVRRLGGTDYRVAESLPWQEWEAAERQYRALHVQRVVQEITARIDRGDFAGVETLHAQLVELGDEPLSLALRVQQAHRQEDLLGQLEFTFRLVQKCENNPAAIREWLKHYAMLLERVCQFDEAWVMCKRLAALSEDGMNVSADFERLQVYANAVLGDDYVIESDVPLPILIRAGMVIRKPLTGKYVLYSLEARSCRGTMITPEAIVETYQKLRLERNPTVFPAAQYGNLWWISRAGVQRSTIVALEGDGLEELRGLRLGMRVVNAALDTVLIPFAFLDTGMMEPACSPLDRNQRLLELLSRIDHAPVVRGWLDRLRGALIDAARRATTRALAATSQL